MYLIISFHHETDYQREIDIESLEKLVLTVTKHVENCLINVEYCSFVFPSEGQYVRDDKVKSGTYNTALPEMPHKHKTNLSFISE